MNADIRGEHDAIVHYLTHAWTVADLYGGNIESIARDEMRHLKWLAHTVVHLRGVPDFSPREVSPVVHLREALEIDIAAESEAIAQYEDHQARIDDAPVQALIGRILVDERDHRRQFREMLNKAPEGTWSEKAGDEAVSAAASNLQRLLSVEYRQILEYLFRYFVNVHGSQMGMTDEDRAVDEMKHLGWMAESMADLGRFPQWEKAPDPARGQGQFEEDPIYGKVLRWAQQENPDMVPLVERMIRHEEYQTQTGMLSPWTVGPLNQSERRES